MWFNHFFRSNACPTPMVLRDPADVWFLLVTCGLLVLIPEMMVTYNLFGQG
ncbi:hypothetical protein JNW90_17545 [Micromonospora sp. STR1s_5]|nr:hypothetical protein [Micromonospora sp. STR1s_5]